MVLKLNFENKTLLYGNFNCFLFWSEILLLKQIIIIDRIYLETIRLEYDEVILYFRTTTQNLAQNNCYNVRNFQLFLLKFNSQIAIASFTACMIRP